MSVNLKILPQYDDESNFSRDVLQLVHEYDLFDLIVSLEHGEGDTISRPFGSHVGSKSAFERYCYGDTEKSAFDDTIKEIVAIEFKVAIQEYKSEYWRNRAVLAFIKQLPDNIRLWLYWH